MDEHDITEQAFKNGYEKGKQDAVKWIPVAERMPEEDTDVIAFCYWHESWQVQVCHLSSNWGQWYTSIAGQWVKVTHWMPLPQPPKE